MELNPKVTRMNRSSNWEWLCTGGDFKVADDGVVVSYWDYKKLYEVFMDTAIGEKKFRVRGDNLEEDNKRLKAEIKRLEIENAVWRRAEITAVAYAGGLADENGKLKAGIKRLCDAGDGVVERLRVLGAKSDFSMHFINQWESAKEVQS